jgi:predicted transposase YbfD/YdcC
VAQFLTPLWAEGRIISSDARPSQCVFCASVTRWKGHYVLIAKENQPTLREDVRLFFSEPPANCRDWRTARTGYFGHGRLEIRELVATTELTDFLGGQEWRRSFASRAPFTKMARRVPRWSMTSPASAQRLLELVRDHWSIENRLHWRRDVTLREDHCRVRKGNAPRVLAVLNSFLLALLDFLGVSNVPQQMRFFDAQPWQAVRLLLDSLLIFI